MKFKATLTFALLFTLILVKPLTAQELNCKVTVLTQRLQTADKKIFSTLQTSIFEFMNNRKWTDDVFQPEERIECSMLINVTDELGSNQYKATVSIQVSRTAFNTSYSTPILNYADKDWVFTYVEYQPLEFNENQFTDNLTSMLAFYAYYIIGLDYDTYSLQGGTPYFQDAQTVLNNVPSNLGDNAPGWKPTDGQRNRYWMLENTLSPKFEVMREINYQYHIKGLDVMYENTTNGRQVILAMLKKMQPIVERYPNAMIIQMWFDAKREELIKMFTGAPPAEKIQAYNLLVKLDATNQDKYNAIKK